LTFFTFKEGQQICFAERSAGAFHDFPNALGQSQGNDFPFRFLSDGQTDRIKAKKVDILELRLDFHPEK